MVSLWGNQSFPKCCPCAHSCPYFLLLRVSGQYFHADAERVQLDMHGYICLNFFRFVHYWFKPMFSPNRVILRRRNTCFVCCAFYPDYESINTFRCKVEMKNKSNHFMVISPAVYGGVKANGRMMILCLPHQMAAR